VVHGPRFKKFLVSSLGAWSLELGAWGLGLGATLPGPNC